MTEARDHYGQPPERQGHPDIIPDTNFTTYFEQGLYTSGSSAGELVWGERLPAILAIDTFARNQAELMHGAGVRLLPQVLSRQVFADYDAEISAAPKHREALCRAWARYALTPQSGSGSFPQVGITASLFDEYRVAGDPIQALAIDTLTCYGQVLHKIHNPQHNATRRY